MTLQFDSDEVARLKAERAELDKKIKLAEKDAKVNALVDSWLNMEEYKSELKALQAKYRFSKEELSKCPTLYKYRDGKRRTNDENTDWVKEYISKGGSISDLENNAMNFLTREATKQLRQRRKKTTSKARTVSKKSVAKKSSSASKGNAKRSDGGVDKKGIGVGSTL